MLAWRHLVINNYSTDILFLRRIDDGERLCKDLITLVQERANIEKEFAKQLKQWSGKWNNLIEKGKPCQVESARQTIGQSSAICWLLTFPNSVHELRLKMS